MPRNKTGGRNHKKMASKHAQPSTRGVRLAKDEAEVYAKVIKLCGNGRADVMCADGVTRLLEIRKKFRGRNKRDNMISVDAMVLVGVRDWEVLSAGKKEKVDLLYVYSQGQHGTLLKDEDACYLLTGSKNSEEDSGGFHIGNTATWKQKMEEEENKDEKKATVAVENPIGMNPLEDMDFNWEDI